jgi:hypothetical protein
MADQSHLQGPPGDADNDDEGKVTIHIREGGGAVVSFKMKTESKMRKIFKAYADTKGIPLGNFRLVTADGQNVSIDVTPKSMGFENEEVLDVLSAQVGGAAY